MSQDPPHPPESGGLCLGRAPGITREARASRRATALPSSTPSTRRVTLQAPAPRPTQPRSSRAAYMSAAVPRTRAFRFSLSDFGFPSFAISGFSLFFFSRARTGAGKDRARRGAARPGDRHVDRQGRRRRRGRGGRRALRRPPHRHHARGEGRRDVQAAGVLPREHARQDAQQLQHAAGGRLCSVAPRRGGEVPSVGGGQEPQAALARLAPLQLGPTPATAPAPYLSTCFRFSPVRMRFRFPVCGCVFDFPSCRCVFSSSSCGCVFGWRGLWLLQSVESSPTFAQAGILKEGLLIAPPSAPVTGYMFGKGASFHLPYNYF